LSDGCAGQGARGRASPRRWHDGRVAERPWHDGGRRQRGVRTVADIAPRYACGSVRVRER
jgi:hypothetical protein